MNAQILSDTTWAMPNTVPQTRTICECPVAGFEFHWGPVLVRGLRPGDRLWLVRKPGDRRDPNAIDVYAENGAKLGSIPRRYNTLPAILMDRGTQLSAVVASLRPERPIREMVRINVTAEEPSLTHAA